ncbi:MAG TPA: hypothetical protein ENN64_00800, partial [bacterium]|nr:hypothetical protein [bacterium]
MGLYFKARKVDLEMGDGLHVLLNNELTEKEGIKEGQKVLISYRDIELYVDVIQTDTKVAKDEIGLSFEIWSRYSIPNGDRVYVSMFGRPDSIDYIKKKLMGSKLSKDEIYVITKEISERKIRDIEVAYFMACFFNPGFDDSEVVDIAQGMAHAGDILDFKNSGKNSDMKGAFVVDKHSIGGIPAKGVTPLLVPIISAAGLLIPNTSTRAITSPAGTSDILETVMPIALSNEKVVEVVKKTNGCMIWGGALKLAPADDVMISVEKALHVQSYNKLVASIVAKKIAMGIDKILIDIPYGPSAKVKSPEDAEMLSEKFIKIFDSVGIESFPYTRFVMGPDGRGIGPVLEMRDILHVLERNSERPHGLERTALEMTGKLLEISGKSAEGRGYDTAYGFVESGRALEKFWEIAFEQGAKKRVKAADMKPGN